MSALYPTPQNKDAGDSDSEAEQEKLEELESYLKEFDPEFKELSRIKLFYNAQTLCKLEKLDLWSFSRNVLVWHDAEDYCVNFSVYF